MFFSAFFGRCAKDFESTIVSELNGINDFVTPKARETILTSGAHLGQRLNAAFAPFEVEFEGATFSQMVKRSPTVPGLAAQGDLLERSLNPFVAGRLRNL